MKPVKGIVSHGNKELRVTACNSCPTNSGASAVLVMSEKKALELGLEPLARIIGWGNGGVKQYIIGMGSVPAILLHSSPPWQRWWDFEWR